MRARYEVLAHGEAVKLWLQRVVMESYTWNAATPRRNVSIIIAGTGSCIQSCCHSFALLYRNHKPFILMSELNVLQSTVTVDLLHSRVNTDGAVSLHSFSVGVP